MLWTKPNLTYLILKPWMSWDTLTSLPGFPNGTTPTSIKMHLATILFQNNQLRRLWGSNRGKIILQLIASMTWNPKFPWARVPCSVWSPLTRAKWKKSRRRNWTWSSAKSLRAIMRTSWAHRSKRKNYPILIRRFCPVWITRSKWVLSRKTRKLKKRPSNINPPKIYRSQRVKLKKLHSLRCLLRVQPWETSLTF